MALPTIYQHRPASNNETGRLEPLNAEQKVQPPTSGSQNINSHYHTSDLPRGLQPMACRQRSGIELTLGAAPTILDTPAQ